MESTSEAKFAYHRFEFPVRGPHSYGDGVGAPRSGHTHQGQDVLARCGTPLVAARGGRVQWKAYRRRRRQLPGDRRQEDRATTTSTCT